MGIAISLGLLKFALSGIDLLAWFASIRAVENDSKCQMRKLVIYWTLFSLFSLSEFAFVKIIEWIPFWSSVRLVIIFWLVMPQFEGAWLAYQGLVRSVLLVRLQAVIDSFYKLKEERLCKRETFLDVIEKYIKENGSEALEKLIVLEHESKKCIDFKRDTKIIESEGESTAVTSELIHYEQPISSARILNGADVVTNVKEMTPPEASTENRRPEILPLKKTQQEWTCDLCKVTTMSEAMLNAHLQGSKHKSKLESLKASLLDAKDTGPSTLQWQVQHTQSVSAAWYPKGTYAAAEVKEMMPPKETAEKRCPKTIPLQKAQQDWTCDLCKVTTTSKQDLNAHLHGSKHKFTLETLKAGTLGAKHTGSSPSGTNKLNHGNAAEKFMKESGSELEKLTTSKTQTGHEACSNSHRDIQVVESENIKSPAASKQVVIVHALISSPEYNQVQHAQSVKAVWVPKGTDANAEVKETKPPEASRAEIPPLKKVQQELNGALKTSKLPTKGTGLPPLATCKPNQGYLVVTETKDGEGSVRRSSKSEIFKHRCIVCDVKLLSDIDVASHLKGKLHSSNIQNMEKHEAMIS